MAAEKKMDSVILGLLSHEELTGYEIKRRMDTTLSYFWGASFGSIYPTLSGLVQDGLAEAREDKETGRKKVVYSITEKGRAHLRAWLALPAEKDEIRYETLLKLFFGAEAGPQEAIRHVERFHDQLAGGLPYLLESVKCLEAIQDTGSAHTYYLLTAKFGVKAYRAFLEWCEETQAFLEEKADPIP